MKIQSLQTLCNKPLRPLARCLSILILLSLPACSPTNSGKDSRQTKSNQTADQPGATTAPAARPGTGPIILTEAVKTAIRENRAEDAWAAILPQLNNRCDTAESPIAVRLRADDRLTWLMFEWNAGNRNDDWVVAWIAPSGVLVADKCLSVAYGTKPDILADASEHLVALSYSTKSTGTGVSYTCWNLVGPPMKSEDGSWQQARTLYSNGLEQGYCGEWFSTNLMAMLFGNDYQPSGDKQLILFDIAYEPTMRDGELFIHRHGKIRLSTYAPADIDDLSSPLAPTEQQIDISEYWSVDQETGSASPAI